MDFDDETCSKCLGVKGYTCVCYDDTMYDQIVEWGLLEDAYDWHLEQKYRFVI